MAFQLGGMEDALPRGDGFALRSDFKCQNATAIGRLASSESVFMSRKVFYGWLLRYWEKHWISRSRGTKNAFAQGDDGDFLNAKRQHQ
jgi:hypothetical protein